MYVYIYIPFFHFTNITTEKKKLAKMEQTCYLCCQSKQNNL